MHQKLIEHWQAEFETADTETVRQMLAEAPELVNVKVNRRSPLLSASLKLKDLDKVKALVEAGADVNNGDLGTHWPSKDYEINRYLISQGLMSTNRPILGFMPSVSPTSIPFYSWWKTGWIRISHGPITVKPCSMCKPATMTIHISPKPIF